MILAIDAGNTNTVFAVLTADQGEIRAQWRTGTSITRTADEYVVWLHHLMSMNEIDPREIVDCVISSVVPPSLFNLRNLARRYFGVDPLVVGENANLDVFVRLNNPQEVGADRLVNALGAHVRYRGALLLIDSGTATTFDVVGEDGAFEGGVISPGMHLSLQALHHVAAKLPRVAIRRPERAIGRDTVEAMQSGIYWGYIGLIEGMIHRMRAEYDAPMTVVATGGVASLFENATDAIDHFDGDLTVRGLFEIYRRNADTTAARRAAAPDRVQRANPRETV